MPAHHPRAAAAPAAPSLPLIAALLIAALLIAALACINTGAHAQASINECEAIQAADAYNQCLAKFGPEQKSQNLAPERPSDMKNSSEEAAAGAGRSGAPPRTGVASRRHRPYGAFRGYGGRKRMTIPVRRRR